LNQPVEWIRRQPTHVQIKLKHGPMERFDEVIIATHSDQALGLLADPTPREREILGAIPYQENEAVLHTDARLLPHRKLAWAAWNYHLPAQPKTRVAVTYNMNILQNLDAPVTFCVTLNRSEAIDPARILYRTTYHHPVFTDAAVQAQARRDEISGVNQTWYCGAYWGYGFHEDGVNSGLAVARGLLERRAAA
jgi:predicted NAD/FAD-binding protein